MKPRILLACLLASALSADAAVSTNSTPVATNALGVVPTNAYPLHIVTCREDVDVDALLAEFQINLQNPKHKMRALKMFAALLDDALIQRLKSDPRVIAVEADGPVSLCGQVNPNGMMRLGIPEFPPAHINGTTEPIDVDVAILDSGMNPHEDLNIYTNYSVYDDTAFDTFGHGTAIAGMLGALDNGVGMVGVAPGVRIWNVQCSAPPPHNTWANLLGGTDYVLLHADKISVVSISLVNDQTAMPVNAIKFTMRSLVRSGIVVVAAAGNSGWDLAGPDQIYDTGDDALPAASPYAMAVSGMDATPLDWDPLPGTGPPYDKIAPFSNYSQVPRPAPAPLPFPYPQPDYPVSPGGAIDVAAPAVSIRYPTWDDSSAYNYGSGTSYAAPHVAGLVALYIAANGRATNEYGVYKIRQAIIDASLPQSQWRPKGNPFDAITNNTGDPDTNPEPLAIASENWVPRPVITNIAGAPGNFSVKFAAVPGYDYTVQSATNLTAPIPWENLRTVSGGSNVALVNVTDTNAASQRFYRLARKATGGGVPPVISIQTVSGWAKLPGTIVNFDVSVLIGTPPFSYLWQKDGSPLADGGNISGAATASLVLTNLQTADAGAYRVVVTNAYGSVTSTVTTITILTNWTSALVTGVLATATSQLWDRYALNTVNSSIGFIWESVGVGQFGEDRKPAITFDLGTVRRLETTVIWNGSEPHAAIKRMFIEVSNDGVSFSSLGEFTLTTLSPASETLSLGGVVGRYVRFTIRENGAGQLFPAITATVLAGGFAELDEVEFHEYQGN